MNAMRINQADRRPSEVRVVQRASNVVIADAMGPVSVAGLERPLEQGVRTRKTLFELLQEAGVVHGLRPSYLVFR